MISLNFWMTFNIPLFCNYFKLFTHRMWIIQYKNMIINFFSATFLKFILGFLNHLRGQLNAWILYLPPMKNIQTQICMWRFLCYYWTLISMDRRFNSESNQKIEWRKKFYDVVGQNRIVFLFNRTIRSM